MLGLVLIILLCFLINTQTFKHSSKLNHKRCKRNHFSFFITCLFNRKQQKKKERRRTRQIITVIREFCKWKQSFISLFQWRLSIKTKQEKNFHTYKLKNKKTKTNNIKLKYYLISLYRTAQIISSKSLIFPKNLHCFKYIFADQAFSIHKQPDYRLFKLRDFLQL